MSFAVVSFYVSRMKKPCFVNALCSLCGRWSVVPFSLLCVGFRFFAQMLVFPLRACKYCKAKWGIQGWSAELGEVPPAWRIWNNTCPPCDAACSSLSEFEDLDVESTSLSLSHLDKRAYFDRTERWHHRRTERLLTLVRLIVRAPRGYCRTL